MQKKALIKGLNLVDQSHVKYLIVMEFKRKGIFGCYKKLTTFAENMRTKPTENQKYYLK